MNSYAHVIAFVMETPWAILPEKLEAISHLLAIRASGERLSDDEVVARTGGAAPHRPAQRGGAVGVLPVYGTLMPRANMMTRMSGGTTYESLARDFTAMVNDPSVRAIVMDIDSPGGAVAGTQELADAIYGARGRKPIVAVANHMAASAAYWIASAADEIVTTPSADLGSIGVYGVHLDESEAMAKAGVRATVISAGKYKTEGLYGPLSEEALAARQERVDAMYSQFVNTVARNRGVAAAEVRSGYGEGRVVSGREAVRAGMADRLGTLDSVLRELGAAEGGVVVPLAAYYGDDAEAAHGLPNGSRAHTLNNKRRMREIDILSV